MRPSLQQLAMIAQWKRRRGSLSTSENLAGAGSVFQSHCYVSERLLQMNPLKRIAPSGLAESYDAEKYVEMLLDVTESTIGVFGFSRRQLGFERKPRLKSH